MKEEKKETREGKNAYTTALNTIGWVILFVGLIGSFSMGDALRIGWDYNYGVLVAGAFASTCSCVLLLGLGEIIRILDDNRYYLRKIAGDTSEYKKDEIGHNEYEEGEADEN